MPFRRFVAGVFLAALRKQHSHHSVYLVHSAHQLSLDVAPQERLLPLFWAVDHFKWHQQRFPTPPVNCLTGALPTSEKSESEFHEAMRQRDTEGAERAVTALARSAGGRQAFDILWQYGCRDGSLIGHRAIAVTNSWRTLETVGWQHAEPVLRFVVYNLLTTNGSPDRYYQPNLARTDQILRKAPLGWAGGVPDRAATLELFAELRQGQSERACEVATRLLSAGHGAQSLWDGVHIAAAELLILHPSTIDMGTRPLHANTAANALHFAFHASTAPRVRLLILLQATAWAGDFVRVHLNDQVLKETSLFDLEGVGQPALARDAVQELFDQLPPRTYEPKGRVYILVDRDARTELGRKAFAIANQGPEAAALFMRAARSSLCTKAVTEAHEFKLPSALFEDYELVSPLWRPRLLAASTHWLHGRQSPDSELLQQVRQALQKL